VAVRTLLEVVYVCTHFLSPVLVEAAGKIFTMLNTPAVPIRDLKPSLDNLTPGTPISAAASKKAGEAGGEVLFEKGETGEVKARIAAEGAKKKAAREEAERKRATAAAAEERAKAGGGTGGPEEDLHKLDLRVGKVVDVAKHPEADALYVEQARLRLTHLLLSFL
jgi:tRNA-binding EMAP/Myf-like protein